MNQLIIVCGATASGKTDFAIQIAQELKTHVISADSRQIYQEMSIGTAVPTSQQLLAVPHHLVQHTTIHRPYSAGIYEREALEILEKLFQDHAFVVACGGTGLYIQALTCGLNVFPEVSPEILHQVQQDFIVNGITFLQEELRLHDFKYYEEVDLQNPQRLIRALSIIRASGQPFSRFRDFNQLPQRSFQVHKIAIQLDRATLYDRINERVHNMVAAGLEQEAFQLYAHRYHPALQTVGYQEWFDYFDGSINRSETIELIQQHTRNYAKRQLTWFQRDSSIRWVNSKDDWEAAISSLL